MDYQGPACLQSVVKHFHGNKISFFHRVSQLEIKGVQLNEPELLTEFHYATRIVVDCWPEFNESKRVVKVFGDEFDIETSVYGDLTRHTITQ